MAARLRSLRQQLYYNVVHHARDNPEAHDKKSKTTIQSQPDPSHWMSNITPRVQALDHTGQTKPVRWVLTPGELRGKGKNTCMSYVIPKGETHDWHVYELSGETGQNTSGITTSMYGNIQSIADLADHAVVHKEVVPKPSFQALLSLPPMPNINNINDEGEEQVPAGQSGEQSNPMGTVMAEMIPKIIEMLL